MALIWVYHRISAVTANKVVWRGFSRLSTSTKPATLSLAVAPFVEAKF